MTHIVLVVSLLLQLSLSQSQYIDHAFRKFSPRRSYDNKDAATMELLKDIPRQSDIVEEKVLKKVGVAAGEVESKSETEPVHHHQLLKRVGHRERDHDQMAVENKPKKGLRQFSSGKLGNRFTRKTNKIIDDVANYAKEHRYKVPNAYVEGANKARNLLVVASNTAFQGTTIATYLTQMWTANILQTVGWALVGIFYSGTTKRSFDGRSSSDSADLDEDIVDSLLSSIDADTVAGVLRGLADYADRWHDEL